MYWNGTCILPLQGLVGLTLTWDVLKFYIVPWCWICILININMRCIEMKASHIRMKEEGQININMRCIEILLVRHFDCINRMININMRCIEIICIYGRLELIIKININMRCIEITIYDPYDLECSWLTLTWDVLK